MKKKYIIRGIVVVGLIALCFYIFSPLDGRKLTKQVFGIDENEYKVISRDNKLKKHKYDGSYKIILQVKDNQMDTFLSEIQSASYCLRDINESYEGYSTYIKSTIGLELNDKMQLYIYGGSTKRSIFYARKPRTVEGIVVYSQCVDGYYEVYLYYWE